MRYINYDYLLTEPTAAEIKRINWSYIVGVRRLLPEKGGWPEYLIIENYGKLLYIKATERKTTVSNFQLQRKRRNCIGFVEASPGTTNILFGKLLPHLSHT